MVELEQAIYGGQDRSGYKFLARSPGFEDEWLPEAERLCAGFGERPAGVACPACVLAQPFGKRLVAVIQVADQGIDDAGRPGVLAFHLLILTRQAYQRLGGDPFLVAERFPPPWHRRGELPALTWPGEPIPPRTCDQVVQILNHDEGPHLLGGAQALVDGGKIVFERPGPDTELIKDLWTLLPTTTRWHLWPASFAFSNLLGFDAVIVPRASGVEYSGYLREEQAADYPESRYELHLEMAAKTGDQAELDRLFSRRSRAETWRLGIALLVFCGLLVIGINWISPRPQSSGPQAPRLKLPPATDYPTLDAQERQRLQESLADLASRLGVEPQREAASPENLLAMIAQRLPAPASRQEVGDNLTSGPVQRRLRALLWQQGVPEYNDPALNTTELVERLEKKLASRKEKH